MEGWRVSKRKRALTLSAIQVAIKIAVVASYVFKNMHCKNNSYHDEINIIHMQDASVKIVIGTSHGVHSSHLARGELGSEPKLGKLFRGLPLFLGALARFFDGIW